MLLQHISFQCHQQFKSRDLAGVIVLYLDLQLPMHSVPIITNVVLFEPRSWRGAIDTTLCDKVCQCLVAGRLFSPVTLVSTTNKTDRHDIAEIFLKVGLKTIYQTTN
jgi:hypothetical protein